VRLPLPEESDDEQWKQDQITILQALGLLDADGEYTDRLEVIRATDAVRLTKEAWDSERDRMVRVCTNCHSGSFTRAELAKGDDMVRQSDRLLAEAIRILTDLYKEGVLQGEGESGEGIPDLLTMRDVPKSPIEQKLFSLFLRHRVSAIQGTFHNNPEYAMWKGWASMHQELAEIREMANALRRDHPPSTP
jgi:hypothetical protein